MDLWIIFITGLTVGGLTCLAVQGGLLAAMVAKEDQKSYLWPTGSFLVAKLVAYTILGFLLGAFGSLFTLSDTVRIVIQIIAGAYMVIIALSLLGWISPRLISFRPPSFLAEFTREKIRERSLFAPIILGAVTIFIPCGTTLAMEALAISSGSAILGGLIMGTFILGTMPLFLGAGFLTSKVRNGASPVLLKLAALIILYLGITSINGSLVLIGSPVTLASIRKAIPIQINLSGNRLEDMNNLARVENGVQIADISVFPRSYSPNYIKVQSGLPVKLNLTTTGGNGCTSAFRIPSLGIAKNLPKQSTETVEFTPQKPEKITWTCSMGMYYGVIEVI